MYIDFYSDCRKEFEPEEWQGLIAALGSEPQVCVVADISGRHPGDEQVREFVLTLLALFKGIAQDDYTWRCWTSEDIRSGRKVEGHGFFEYDREGGRPWSFTSRHRLQAPCGQVVHGHHPRAGEAVEYCDDDGVFLFELGSVRGASFLALQLHAYKCHDGMFRPRVLTDEQRQRIIPRIVACLQRDGTRVEILSESPPHPLRSPEDIRREREEARSRKT